MTDLRKPIVGPSPAHSPGGDSSGAAVSRIRPHNLVALTRRPAFAPATVGLIAFLVSFVGNWIPSVWYDEAATITSATRTWGQLWTEIQSVDAVHAAYYAFMHLVFDVVGYSPLTLRLPSAFAVGGAAALIVVLVRSFDRPRAAVLAGLVFAVIPRVTWAGGEGRSYAISMLLAIALTAVFVKASRSLDRRWWFAYAALALVSCLVFVYLALILVAHAVTVAGLLAQRRRAALPLVRHFAAAAIAVAVLLIPFVLLLKGEKAQVSWIAPIGQATIQQVYLTQWFWGTALFPAFAWALILIGSVLMARRWRGLSLAAVILPALVLPTVLLILASVVYEPSYSPRYLTMGAPFVAIAMGVAIDRIARRIHHGRLLPALAVLALAAIALPHVIDTQRTPEAKQQAAWSQVADLVAANRVQDGPAEQIAIIWGPVRQHITATSRVIEYAYPAAFAGTVDVTLRTPAAETGTLWETHAKLTDSLQRMEDTRVAYLITSDKQDRRPATTATLASIGWHLDEEWHFSKTNVLRYMRG